MMDCSSALWYSLTYDSVQLHRIEMMLTELMMKLLWGHALKVFDFSGSDVADPCAAGPLNQVSVSKSKQRRMRAALTKRRMWSQLRECVKGNEVGCEASPQEVRCVTSEAVGGGPQVILKAMFQKLAEVETKVESVGAIAAQAELNANEASAIAAQGKGKANQVMAVAESLDDGAASEEVPAVQVDMDLLQSLRGQPKEEAMIKLFLNKIVEPPALEGTLFEMEKYFESDMQQLGSFLAMKFGIRACTWSELRSLLLTEVSTSPAWQNGCTLGMVLKDMRKQRSNNRSSSAESARNLTDELVRPRRKKRGK